MKAHGGRVGFAFPEAGGFAVVLTFPRAAGSGEKKHEPTDPGRFMHARDMYSIVAVVIEAVALRMPRDQPVQLVVLTIAEQPAQRIDIRARVDVDRIDMLLQLPLPIPNSPFFIRIETAFSWKPSACASRSAVTHNSR